MVTETYDNDDHFDITYIIIVWFAFLPTVIVPWFIAHWLLIGALRKADRFMPYNNGNGNHHHRRHSQRSLQRQAANEAIMVHELSRNRPNDHPTPGKINKRPRTKNGEEVRVI